jgi:anti-repressor protein
MNQLINLQNKVLTMSSREIAELTNKEHRNVKRDIKNMLEQLNISVLSFEQTYKDVQNKQQIEYLLPKKYIECLLTGYSIPLRMKVIDRMHELEEIVNQQPLKLPTSKELALMVIQAEEEKEKLQLEVDYLKPKAEFHDMAVDIHGAVSVGQAAKTLGTGRNRLLQLMRQSKWINRRNEPYQDKIEQGLLDVKLSNWEHPEKGIQEVITTLVTGKGITKLTKMLSTKLVA